jgi:hypothetical protein
MSPIAAECGGGGGGSTVGSQALGAMERGRRADTEAGLDDGCARRRHQGRSTTKHDGGRGGGVEAEEKVASTACTWAYFFMQKEETINY